MRKQGAGTGRAVCMTWRTDCVWPGLYVSHYLYEHTRQASVYHAESQASLRHVRRCRSLSGQWHFNRSWSVYNLVTSAATAQGADRKFTSWGEGGGVFSCRVRPFLPSCHRRSQDFLWGYTFYQKVDDLFTCLVFVLGYTAKITKLTTATLQPSAPSENFLKILTSCYAWGALTTYPYKLCQQNFLPWGARAFLATPMFSFPFPSFPSSLFPASKWPVKYSSGICGSTFSSTRRGGRTTFAACKHVLWPLNTQRDRSPHSTHQQCVCGRVLSSCLCKTQSKHLS